MIKCVWLDCWGQGNTDLLSIIIILLLEGKTSKQLWGQTFLQIKGTVQKSLGSKEPELKTF